MNGWVPMNVRWWHVITERLEGTVWTREEALMDLRVEWDQHRTLPSHDTLARRWGWFARGDTAKPSLKKVRRLKASQEWYDPSKKKGQGRGRAGAGQGQGRGHTRVDPPSPSPSPSPRTNTCPKEDPMLEQVINPVVPLPMLEQAINPVVPMPAGKGPQVDRWPEVAEAYQVMRHSSGVQAPKPTRSKGMGKILDRLVKREGIDATLVVLRWVATSDHHRAAYLREGQYGAKTLARPGNFADYLELAEGAGEAPKASKARGAVDDFGYSSARRQAAVDAFKASRHRGPE